MKTKKYIIAVCILIIATTFLIINATNVSKVFEVENTFYIRNVSKEPLKFMYEKDGNETYTYKTKTLLPGEVECVYGAKKVKVVGHINLFAYQSNSNNE